METRDIILDTLLGQLKERDEFVRRSAVEELGELKSECGIAPLLELLKSEKNIAILEAAGDSLVKIGTEQMIRGVIEHLDSGEAVVRNLVCEILARMGSESINVLLEKLSSDDEDIRKFAVDVLGDIRNTKVTGELEKLLDDPCVNVACSAAESLGKIGADSSIDSLVNTVRNGNRDVGYYAVIALGKIDDEKARGFLAELLNNEKDPIMKHFAIESLGVKENWHGVDILKVLLKNEEELVQKAALKSLGRIDVRSLDGVFRDTKDDELIKCVLSALVDEDDEIKKYGLIALGMMDTIIGLKELMLLTEKDGELSPFVVQNLIKIGKKDLKVLLEMVSNDKIREILPIILGDVQNHEAIGLLKGLLRDKKSSVWANAARALGKLGLADVYKSLITLLGDTEAEVRISSAMALGWLGCKEAVEDLAGMLEDNNSQAAETAATALAMICGDEILKALKHALSHERESVREKAIQALGMCPKTEQIEEILAQALSDESWNVRKAAVIAIDKYLDGVKVGLIEPLLKDSNSRVRIIAVKMVGKMGGADAVDRLAPLIGDADPWVKYEAVRMLGRFKGEKVVEILMKALAEGGNIVKIAACESLADIGCVEAKGEVKKLLSASDQNARQAAEKALEKLGK